MGTTYRALLLAAVFGSCTASPRAVEIEVDGRPVAVYRLLGADPPPGVGEDFVRGAYLHPVLTPSGRAVTGDYPPSHRHQHGVSFPWTRTRCDGRDVDYWNTGARQGTLAAHRVGRKDRSHLFQHDFVDLTAPGDPQVVLHDYWVVTPVACPEATVIDLFSQQCAARAPVEILEYHYGGFSVRGALAWEDGCSVLTSEGHQRAEADGARVRWCALYGDLEDGELATLAVLSHPDNFRAPQPVRVHPDVPYFCFAPCRSGAFTITKDEPFESHYRVVACDGPPDPALLDALWEELARSSTAPSTARAGRTPSAFDS